MISWGHHHEDDFHGKTQHQLYVGIRITRELTNSCTWVPSTVHLPLPCRKTTTQPRDQYSGIYAFTEKITRLICQIITLQEFHIWLPCWLPLPLAILTETEEDLRCELWQIVEYSRATGEWGFRWSPARRTPISCSKCDRGERLHHTHPSVIIACCFFSSDVWITLVQSSVYFLTNTTLSVWWTNAKLSVSPTLRG